MTEPDVGSANTGNVACGCWQCQGLKCDLELLPVATLYSRRQPRRH